MKKSLFLLVTTVIFLSACQQEEPVVIHRQINTTLSKNEEVNDYSEWMASEYHPEMVFKFWRDNDFKSSEVCAELNKLMDLDLTVFEDEIRSEQNKDLLKGCQTELKSRLVAYWKKENSQWKDYPNRFEIKNDEINIRIPLSEKITSEMLKPKQVVLTFDDGPHSIYTMALLKILNRLNIKAHFFLLGEQVHSYPEIIRQEALAGHSLGTHTYTHRCVGNNRHCKNTSHGFVSVKSSIEEISKGFKAVLKVLGWVHPFFRYPYGESSREISNYLYEKGISEFYWSIDSEDWKKQSTSELLHKTLSKVEAKGRGTILFHDVQRKTIEIMVPLLYELKNRGYIFVVYRAPRLNEYEN